MDNWWQDRLFVEAMTPDNTSQEQWDSLFMDMAYAVSQQSKCASRKIGAVLVRDNRMIAMGFNGSPSGSRFCQNAPYCPRKKLGIPSGKGIELCPAQHAEENTIHNAARFGVSTEGATLYCYCGIPCQRCSGALINAGVKEIVTLSDVRYDDMCVELLGDAKVKVRAIHKNYVRK